MPKLTPHEQEQIDNTLASIMNTLRATINSMHVLDHSSVSWPFMQRTTHHLSKAFFDLEQSIKDYECECAIHNRQYPKRLRN